MKHRYTIKQNFFYYLSRITNLIHPLVNIPRREMGISVMMRVKNEEKWIKASLISLNNFADEVVIVNNASTDSTKIQIEEVADKLKYEVIYRENDNPDICVISNFALSLTSYHWIFRWDGDFIAHTSGKNNIKYLRNYLLSLNPQNFYYIYPLTVSFSGDFFHIRNNHALHSEGYIHSYHPSIKYVFSGKFEVLKIPLFFKILRLKKIYFFHIGTVKTLKRTIYRTYWMKWQRQRDFKKYPSLESFLKKNIFPKYDKNEIIKQVIKEAEEKIQDSRKFTKKEFGDYPDLLKPLLKNSNLKIIYKDGKPYSRDDFIQRK